MYKIKTNINKKYHNKVLSERTSSFKSRVGKESSNLTLSINYRTLLPKQRIVVKRSEEGLPSVKSLPGAAPSGLTFYGIEKGR